MGLRSFLGLISVALAFTVVACDSDKAQKVEPETRGKRGERCMARNDCATGLACIGGVCARNEFEIDVSVKHCDRIECDSDEVCCGDRPTMAPAKCDGREQICDPTPVPGCVQTSCTSDLQCNGGTCPAGTCQISGDACTTNTECAEACLANNTCRSTGAPCTTILDCPYNNSILNCSLRTCNCQKPLYDPNDPICNDPDCENICNLRCVGQLCVEDDSCATNAECPNTAPFCDGNRCVQCRKNAECNVDNEEFCEKGQCRRDCQYDEECGIFEECQAGDCVYVGCKSDRECVLVAGRNRDGIGGSGNVIASGDDARLYVCLDSDTETGVKVCRVPCENDGNCSQLEVCEEGYCKFVGCKDDFECRSYLGISNQIVSEAKPYVATAICTDAPRSDSDNAN